MKGMAAAVLGLFLLVVAPIRAGAAPMLFQDYVDSVQPTLDQWWNALEALRGVHFLLEPEPSALEGPAEVDALLSQWWSALESWRGVHFLLEPTADIDEAAELYPLLVQWHSGLEAFAGRSILLVPAAPIDVPPGPGPVPVPEPSTLTLLVLGVASLLARRPRRQAVRQTPPAQ